MKNPDIANVDQPPDPARKAVFAAFAGLLNYPEDDYASIADALIEALPAYHAESIEDLQAFQKFVHKKTIHQLEEHFNRTFEINPQCSLELGWHLFGEEYMRGMFLVRMREELRRFELPESTELPDHATHVLAVLAAMPQEDAGALASACVQPALDKMLEAFEEKQNEYEYLLRGLRLVLCREFDLPETSAEDDVNDDAGSGTDPLWSYPVRMDATPGGPEFVPLHMQFEDSTPVENERHATGGGLS